MSAAVHKRTPITVFLDSRDEGWPSMDRVGDALVTELRTTYAKQVDVQAIEIAIPRIARQLGERRALFNADRVLTRFVLYPARVGITGLGRSRGFFHIVDHTYAQLVHVLPSRRTGVFCHDIDAFRGLFEHKASTAPWIRALAEVTLRGLRAASLVFFSTAVVREEILERRLVAERKLVHAPYGVSEAFSSEASEHEAITTLLRRIGKNHFLLHVGSHLPRKRLDVLFDTFAHLRARFPDLWLVQHGASLTSAQREHVARLGLASRFVHSATRLPSEAIASLYRQATAVLMPSDAEGFGLPVAEALACGALVIASDIPVLREVAGDAAVYCPPGAPQAWAAVLTKILQRAVSVPSAEMRRARAARYSWSRHAGVIATAYAERANEDHG